MVKIKNIFFLKSDKIWNFFSYLWEQFNIINMNLSIFMILGHVCMLLTDIEAIQVDRHLCTAIGNFIQT